MKSSLPRLKINPTEAIKALATEIAAQLTKEYLTIDELAERLSLNRSTVKNKMAAGVFRKGIHYFSPKGLGSQLALWPRWPGSKLT